MLVSSKTTNNKGNNACFRTCSLPPFCVHRVDCAFTSYQLPMPFLKFHTMAVAICNSKSLIQSDFFHLSFIYLSLLWASFLPFLFYSTFLTTLLVHLHFRPEWRRTNLFRRIIYGFLTSISKCVCRLLC